MLIRPFLDRSLRLTPSRNNDFNKAISSSKVGDRHIPARSDELIQLGACNLHVFMSLFIPGEHMLCSSARKLNMSGVNNRSARMSQSAPVSPENDIRLTNDQEYAQSMRHLLNGGTCV
jgi:hypothetical protein